MNTLRTRIIRGAMAGGVARVATIAVGLVMTPYLLTRLGAAQFGLWALATAVAASYGLLDFGFRSAIVKHLAESFARRDQRQTEQIVAACVTLYLGLAILVLAVFALAAPLAFDLFRVPDELREVALPVFFIALSTAAVSSVLAVIPSLLDANQRMDQTQFLGVVSLIAGAALTITLIESGHGLIGLAISQLASSLLFFAGCTWLARRFLTLRFVRPSSLSAVTTKRLFRYGSRLYVSTLCEIVNRHFDKILFSRIGGLPMVASYEIAGRMVGNAGSLQGNLLAPLLPATSRLAELSQRDRLRSLYLKASRLSFFIGIPPFFLLALLAPDVVMAWLGTQDPVAAGVLRLLAVGFLFNTLSHAMAATCQGIGAIDIQARQSLLQVLLNITLSLALLVPFGWWGPPIGTSVALVVGAGYFASRLHPHLDVDNGEFLRTTLLPPLVAAGGATAVAAFVMWLGWTAPATNRLDAMLEIAAIGSVFGAVFVTLCWMLGAMTGRDLSELRSVFSSVPDTSAVSTEFPHDAREGG